MQVLIETNQSKLNNQIQSLAKQGEQVIILGKNDDFNRKILENKKVNMLILNEDLIQKDYMKQRNSGLNEILCKLATKNNITIAIELDKILKKTEIEKAKSLARLKQNITLCKRTKTNLIAISKQPKKLIQSLFLTLGASTQQAKKATEN